MKIKLCFCLMACLFADRGNQLRADEAMWKAGVAKVVVTPETSMWMAGYASRNKPSEGKVHDLHVKALALEDQDEHRDDANKGNILRNGREPPRQFVECHAAPPPLGLFFIVLTVLPSYLRTA
jgi:hypothetical protein